MLRSNQQFRLGVVLALAVEQGLQARTLTRGQDAADDGRGLQRCIFEFGHADRNDHRLGADIDRLSRPGNCRVSTERGNGFALRGEQYQVTRFGGAAAEDARGEGVAQTNDRRRRQGNGPRTGVD